MEQIVHFAQTAFRFLFPLMLIPISIAIALPQTLFFLATHPVIFLNPPPGKSATEIIKRKFFYYFWSKISRMFDMPAYKKPLISRACGVVLEVGAGVGDSVEKYDRSKVTRLVLVEPNPDMTPMLRAAAEKKGYNEKDGSLVLLCEGATPKDLPRLKDYIKPGSIDTVVLMHVMCSIPQPAACIEMYRDFLRPGGEMLFFEHIAAEENFTKKMQVVYDFFWPVFFDGCMFTRPTGQYILYGPGGNSKAGVVEENSSTKEIGKVQGRWTKYEMTYHAPDDNGGFEAAKMGECMPHVYGYAIKA